MKKKIKYSPTEFTFYKENKLDQEYVLTLEELRAKYMAWLITKEVSWVQYYGHQTVVVFITSADGMNSTFDERLEVMQDALIDVRHSLPCYSKA